MDAHGKQDFTSSSKHTDTSRVTILHSGTIKLLEHRLSKFVAFKHIPKRTTKKNIDF